MRAWWDLIEREDWIRDNPDAPDVQSARDSSANYWTPRAQAGLIRLLDWTGAEAAQDLLPHLPETLDG